MTILNTIKEAQLQARRIRDHSAVDLLTTLIGDSEMIGKNNGNRVSTDVEVIGVIKKFINNAEETLKVITSEKQIINCQNEIAILKRYLPQQLTGDSLVEAINSIITEVCATSIKDLGKVMKIIKERYDGRYDGTVASSLVKQLLGV